MQPEHGIFAAINLVPRDLPFPTIPLLKNRLQEGCKKSSDVSDESFGDPAGSRSCVSKVLVAVV